MAAWTDMILVVKRVKKDDVANLCFIVNGKEIEEKFEF